MKPITKDDYIESIYRVVQFSQKIKSQQRMVMIEPKIVELDPNLTSASELRYDACISYDDKSVQAQGEIGVKSIEGGKYVMYLQKGAYEGLKESYQELIDWIIENESSMADKPPFEKYLNRDPRHAPNLRT